MCKVPIGESQTIVIFFPFQLKNVELSYVYGDCELFNQSVKIFFTTKIQHVKSKDWKDIFGSSKCGPINSEKSQIRKQFLLVEVIEAVLTVKQIQIDEGFSDPNKFTFLWLSYDFRLFSLCEFTSTEGVNAYSSNSYFKYLKDKINEKIETKRRTRNVGYITDVVLTFLSLALFKLSQWSTILLPVTKYLNLAVHVDNYLSAFYWAVKLAKDKKRLDIKITNFLLSVLIDLILGILFLNWLNSKVSLDSSASLFLLTAEVVVNSINDLINWLKGDPAGLKLNWAFNSILATFFSFHITIWWTFLVYVKSLVQIIFQVFLKIGLMGITFQASIMADLLALVSLHVYCIHAYAARLYSIQISSLISLWRLFLGRKKNPLREKVDSCRYSPKQLFVGTLAFTILLFLLPTTLLYYVVFTSLKLFIKLVDGTLKFIQFFNQSLPVYTTILWLTRSPKIFGTVEIDQCNQVRSENCVLLNVRPAICSWWETVRYFTPDCVSRPSKINLTSFFNSIITGKHETSSK